MPEVEANVITPAPEPDFSLESYRAEREGKPEEPAKEESAEPEKAPEPDPEPDAGKEEQEQPEEQHAKGKGGFQRRIGKLVQQKAELERQLAERPAVQPEPVAKPAAGEPKLDAFDSYDEYVAALTDWKVEQKFAARAEAEAKAKAEAEAAKVQAEFSTKLDAARAKHEDFDEVVGSAPPITAVMRDFLLDSAVGADLMYQLASDAAETRRISLLSPIAQIKALTALEGKHAPAPETKSKAPSKAPEPIRPVGTSAAPALAYRTDMDQDEYRRWRQAGGGR